MSIRILAFRVLVFSGPGTGHLVLVVQLANNLSISDLFVSIITPIHKKGPKMDPDDYCGISPISCLYKVLTATLNKRLENYCKEEKILPVNTLGFLSDNRTSGHRSTYSQSMV